MEQANQLFPTTKSMLLHSATLLEALNRDKEALEWYQKAFDRENLAVIDDHGTSAAQSLVQFYILHRSLADSAVMDKLIQSICQRDGA